MFKFQYQISTLNNKNRYFIIKINDFIGLLKYLLLNNKISN